MNSRLALFLENVPILSNVNRSFFPDPSKASPFDTPQGAVTESLGIRTRIMDVLQNNQTTVSNLRRANSAAKNALEASVTKYYTERDTIPLGEAQRRVEGIRRLAERQTALEIEIARLDAYILERGMVPSDVEKQLERGGVAAERIQDSLSGIPDPELAGRAEAVQRFMQEQGLN
jgi:hypothetical protein